MNALESYLKTLQEKEWDSTDTWEDHIEIDKLKDILAKKGNIDQEDIDQLRHTIQPMLIKLIKNSGGDYMGRDKTRNSSHGDFSGVEWLMKYLPSDWKEKADKYIEKVARDHK